ncbi:hypothetical protein A3F59_01635 [Candidatus Roizmanbacteria bacterium RIFCSPHIGHO2_12_FULL_38_13]|nr:MAG: hypothetical protein A3F59_01635 [Candidatus Roizmanbacteria bacterium RIFCSPHIGHO2_12_FULL_38_13]
MEKDPKCFDQKIHFAPDKGGGGGVVVDAPYEECDSAITTGDLGLLLQGIFHGELNALPPNQREALELDIAASTAASASIINGQQ